MGARASSWSAGINPPRSNCLDGAQGAVQPCVWYAFTLHTRHYGAAVKWGEAPRYVLELRSHVATRGRSNALTAEDWLTVKASSPAAAGHGVRPSATRHALVGLRRREGIALPACTEPRQTGSPAVTVQRVVCGARSRWLNVQSGRRYAHLCWRVNRRCDTKRTSEKDEA